MKRINTWVRLIGMVFIALFFGMYQWVAVARAKVIAENEAEIAEVEAYNRQIEEKMAADAGAAENEKAKFKDGTYEGAGEGYGGMIELAVVIANGCIDSIEVTDHSTEDGAYYSLAEGLLADIIKKQSEEVDAVTGATFSSEGLIEAVKAALEEAR